MAFNPNYTPTKLITVSNPGAGALPATWTMFNTSETPRDAAGYPPAGGWVYEPATAAVAPATYWNDDSIAYGSATRYLRASASLRVCDNLGAGQGRGSALILLVVGTRAAGDGYGITYGFGTDQGAFSEYGSVYFLQPIGGSTKLKYALLSNTWYRFGVELIGRKLYGYVDSTGYGTPGDVPGDVNLALVGSVDLTQDTNDNIYVGWAASGSYALTNCPGGADFLCEKLSPLASGTAGQPLPGADNPVSFAGAPIPPIDFGGDEPLSDIEFNPYIPPWDWQKGQGVSRFAYQRYKSTRSAAAMLNNVSMQP